MSFTMKLMQELTRRVWRVEGWCNFILWNGTLIEIVGNAMYEETPFIANDR